VRRKKAPKIATFGRQIGPRSLIVQVKYGTFSGETALFAVSSNKKGNAMRKTLVALATVATLAVSAAAPAHAQRGLGAAVAGGIIGGAIVGGAIAASPYGYGPGYYYGPGYGGYGYGPGYGPAYVAADPYGCYWQRQRFWDGFVWRFRRVRVCG
jgi:hypothetical protein